MNKKVNPYPIRKIFKNKLHLSFARDYKYPNMPNENSSSGSSTPSVPVMDIYNSLRVPDAIKDLPQFNGNPRLLFDFLDNCEEILNFISVASGQPYGQLLLRAIRNKITGPANEVLNMYGTPLIWDEIKNNLILHYADKRNETSLIRDLHKVKQHNSTVEKFYSEIIEIYSSMVNHINIHETDTNVIAAKKALYQEMSLNSFLTGLKEPLGSTIRAMKPLSLAEAFSFCIKEQNIFYSKFENKNLPPQNPTSQNRNFNNQRIPPRIQPNMQRPVYSNNRPQFSRPFNPQFIPRQPQQHFAYRNQQPFNNFSRNNSQTTPQNNPTPMDLGSSQVRNFNQSYNRNTPNTNFFRQTRPPNFVSEELFNSVERNEPLSDLQSTENSTTNMKNFAFEMENPSQYVQNLDSFYENYYPIEENSSNSENYAQESNDVIQDINDLEQNFQVLASENPSDM
jgi:hypothetical protein